jgi:DNA-binding MarR family transcriptional regulator/N-acetylglutamate synthase-like GNAT family acetyltransferase
MQDVANIYREQNIDFESRWFPIFYLLSQKAPLSILDAAKLLGITHPAVNQIAGDLIEKGLVQAVSDESDKRKRLLFLTKKGEELIPQLQNVWNDLHSCLLEITLLNGQNIINCLEEVEKALDEKSIVRRYQEKALKASSEIEKLEIIDFKPEYKLYFKSLNYGWIKKYFDLEEVDDKALSNPEDEILANGGFVFFAKLDNKIIGTCALINRKDSIFELSKMAVEEKYQGMHVGEKLVTKAIERAISKDAKAIVLEIDAKLEKAVSLYKKIGFSELPHNEKKGQSKVLIRMILNLKN